MIEFHFLDADDRGIALHVQCPCRIRDGNRVLLGRPEALHVAGRHRFDARSQVLNSFLDGLSDLPEVQIATTRSHGDLTIECSGGLMIEIFPVSVDRSEMWRAFRRGDVDSHVGYPPETI